MLSTLEASVLHQLATAQDLSQEGLMRHALRVYQQIHMKAKVGQRMAFVDVDGNVVKEEVFGLGEVE